MKEYQRAKNRYKRLSGLLENIDKYFLTLSEIYDTSSLNKDQSKVFSNIASDLNDSIKTFNKNVIFADTLTFKYALNDYKDHFSIIYGAAGTGKSYLTAEIIHFFLYAGLKVTVTAPTHKAVNVIREKVNNIKSIFEPPDFKTLHSFLELEMSPDYNTGTIQTRQRRNKKNEINPWTDILIIDEVSMVNSELFNIIVNKLNKGDLVYVLFIGDPNQLPPVNDEDFSVKAYVDSKRQHELKTIVRQSEGNPIIQVSQEIIKYITREKHGRENLLEYIRQSPLHVYSDEYEMLASCIENDDSVLISYTNNKVKARNLALRSYKVPGANEEYIPGESVILQERYTNVLGSRFFNNQEFRIKNVEFKSCSDEANPLLRKLSYYRLYQDISEVGNYNPMYIDVISQESKVLYNNLLTEFSKQASYQTNKEKRKQLWKAYFMLKDRFCTVEYPFAMTIHKSQGSTFGTVYVEMSGTSFVQDEMYYRLLYVGVTRAAKNVYLLF